MKLEYFSYLIVVEKYHSISEAARHLYLGQTTLSAMVKSVEDELGYAVFQRTPKGVVATQKGKEMLKLAREITLKYESVIRIRDEQRIETYPFTLLSACGLTTKLALDLNRKLRESNSNCAINFYDRPRLKIIPDIIQHQGSAGLTYIFRNEMDEILSRCAKYNIIVETLSEDKFYLMVNKRHKFADRQSVNLNELLTERHACSIELTGDTESDDNAPFSSLGRYNSGHRTIFPNTTLVKMAVLHQDMITILPGTVAAGIYDPAFFSIVPLYGSDVPSEINICILHSKEKREVEKEAVEYIREFFTSINVPQPPELAE